MRESVWCCAAEQSEAAPTEEKETTTKKKKAMPPRQQLTVYVPPHPLVKHYLSMARNEMTPPQLFRGSLAELGRILIYEATSDWYTNSIVTMPMRTPCGDVDGEFVDPSKPIRVVPILRAGLVLLENASDVLPCATTHHLGYVRDEQTLQPSLYLNKLPPRFEEDERLLLVDPMLATGGTMRAAVEECVARGAKLRNLRCVVAVCAPPALQVLSDAFPELVIYAGGIDPELDDNGYIVPGLGDAGDRSFGTLLTSVDRRMAAATRLTATLLGVGGALPFIAFTPALSSPSSAGIPTSLTSAIHASKSALSLPSSSGIDAHRTQLSYGASIVSFLGAVHWGSVLADGRHAAGLAPVRLVYGVMPSVLSWMNTASTHAGGGGGGGGAADMRRRMQREGDTLIGILAGAYVVDAVMGMKGLLPSWYMALRTPLTIIAVSSLYASSRASAHEATPDEG